MKNSIKILTITIILITSMISCGERSENKNLETKKEQKEVTSQEEFNINKGTGKAIKKTTSNGEQNNIATIVVKANKAVEYKFKIKQYDKLTYEWKADAPLHYDFHGDPKNKENYPKGYFESYAIGHSNFAKGKITIPYQGSHGWYWKNQSDKDITITLSTKGAYSIIGLIQ